MKVEIWRDIPGYEGIYQVSSNGKVKSVSRLHKTLKGHRISRERLLKPINKIGYHQVNLYKDKSPKKYFIHRLVALAFIPNPKGKPFINHIDAVRNNNNVDNLEWCTQSENVRHCKNLGRSRGPIGEQHPDSKLKDSDVIDIRNRFKSNPNEVITNVAKIYGVGSTAIHNIINYKTWKHL